MKLKTLLIPTVLGVGVYMAATQFDQIPQQVESTNNYSKLEQESERFSKCINFANTSKSALESRLEELDLIDLHQMPGESNTYETDKERTAINTRLSGYESFCMGNKKFQIKDFIRQCNPSVIKTKNEFCDKIEGYLTKDLELFKL